MKTNESEVAAVMNLSTSLSEQAQKTIQEVREFNEHQLKSGRHPHLVESQFDPDWVS